MRTPPLPSAPLPSLAAIAFALLPLLASRPVPVLHRNEFVE